MKLSAIRVDSALIEQGDWVDSIPNLPGIRIRARGTNNKDYRLLEGKLVREIPAGDRAEGLAPADQDRIAGILLLETVVIDVEGLTEEDGKTPLAYTREIGQKLLLDPDFRVFQAGAAYAGGVIAQRRKPVQEIETKNS
ncbi:hypothetical protein [Bradyrhizobium elkanii]|uniref:hypothetical protein n=1 Tax=Bradyrhizobium elkanii TaxID=29448 RepID=UPI000841D748|nr:hypothetical protein [Bradyrhizobium elkanii]ODM77796.1 hypothetical protein A6452_34540 [Bradyrhizobium elkanii]ODM81748.1 hypothetical protein A6X20_18975 [Bradyrhizobium elkanii]